MTLEMDDVVKEADKILNKTQEENRLLKDMLLENAVYMNKHDRWMLSYKKKSFCFWKDHRNDCWCLQSPNGDITDYSYKSNVVEDIIFYIKEEL